MKTKPKVATAMAVFLVLLTAPARAVDFWSPAAPVKLEKIEKLVATLAEKEPQTLRQPAVLGYKAALFLSTGAPDKLSNGRAQNIHVTYEGGEQTFTGAVVEVEFTGYADDSLQGERFEIHMASAPGGVWKIDKIERAAYGREDKEKPVPPPDA